LGRNDTYSIKYPCDIPSKTRKTENHASRVHDQNSATAWGEFCKRLVRLPDEKNSLPGKKANLPGEKTRLPDEKTRLPDEKLKLLGGRLELFGAKL
jgi:hypothetical protein